MMAKLNCICKYSVLYIFVWALCTEADNTEIETAVRDALEFIRPLAKNGAPDLGIIPLDPYFLKYKEIKAEMGNSKIEGTFSDVYVTGTSTFAIRRLDVQPDRTVKLELGVDNLHVKGNYSFKAKLLMMFDVQGKGPYTVDILKPIIRATFKMHRNHLHHWEIQHLHLDLNFSGAKTHFDNLRGSGMSTQEINAMLSSNARSILMPIKPMIIEEMHGIVINNINAALRKMDG